MNVIGVVLTIEGVVWKAFGEVIVDEGVVKKGFGEMKKENRVVKARMANTPQRKKTKTYR